LENFGEEMVIRKCVACRLDDLVFQSLWGWAYNFIHIFHPKAALKAELMKWFPHGYIKGVKKDVIATTASHGGSGPPWPWSTPPISLSSISANFETQYPNCFQYQSVIPSLRDGQPTAFSPYNRRHPKDIPAFDSIPDDSSLPADGPPIINFYELVQLPAGSEETIDPSLLTSELLSLDGDAVMEGQSTD
jgi:hypothetical protein